MSVHHIGIHVDDPTDNLTEQDIEHVAMAARIAATKRLKQVNDDLFAYSSTTAFEYAGEEEET